MVLVFIRYYKCIVDFYYKHHKKTKTEDHSSPPPSSFSLLLIFIRFYSYVCWDTRCVWNNVARISGYAGGVGVWLWFVSRGNLYCIWFLNCEWGNRNVNVCICMHECERSTWVCEYAFGCQVSVRECGQWMGNFQNGIIMAELHKLSCNRFDRHCECCTEWVFPDGMSLLYAGPISSRCLSTKSSLAQ